jgi:hypothetical protein
LAFDIRPQGSVLQFFRYERVQPRRGAALRILQALGLGRARRRIRQIDELAFPFEFALLPGTEVERALDELALLRPDRTPVVLGNPETAANTLTSDQTSLPATWLAELDGLDPSSWIAGRLAQLGDTGTEPPRGPWPTTSRAPTSELTSVRKTLGKREFFPEVVIALVPTAEPALAALHVGYGDWNECPPPIVHAAIARRWSTAHGAAPVAFAGDVVEYRVARPIDSREQAIELALEQFAYCPDIILQGTETVERLAAELLGARYWFFWWD